MPRGEFQPRHSERPGDDRIKQALETLEQGIDVITSSETFAAYLTLLSKLHSYSAQNALLIYLQRPDASMIAGYRRWQELGRQVKKGEKGITILVPYKRKRPPETEEEEERVILSGFGIGHTFDVSQTEGAPLPEPPVV